MDQLQLVIKKSNNTFQPCLQGFREGE